MRRRSGDNLFDIRQDLNIISLLKTPEDRLLFLSESNLVGLLDALARQKSVIAPALREDKVHFVRYEGGKDAVLPLQRIRPCENLKHIYFPPRERVAVFGSSLEKPISETVIIGAKACDLRALEVHDRVFLDPDYVEPFYKERRSKTTIISADCPAPEDTCFCTLVGIGPYVDQGSDLNLTSLNEGYVVEVLSSNGHTLCTDQSHFFTPATESQIEARDRVRREALSMLGLKNKKEWPRHLSRLIAENEKAEFWHDRVNGCVECFACLDICPTCYCFLLYESAENERGRKQIYSRNRIWDACFRASYARVGGGANPRAGFWERFRNRFACKFEYFKHYHDIYACSGCGRCRSGCTARIDIRDVLGEL